MQQNTYVSSLVLGMAVTAMLPLYAAEAVLLQQTSFKQLQQMFHLTLARATHAASHAVTVPIDSLQYIRQHTDENNISHVRMQQEYAGFPVFGGYAVMHSHNTAKTLLQGARPVKMNGMVYRGLEAELGRPTSTFESHANVALQQFKAQYATQTILEEQVTPMVYINAQHRAFWAYKVSVLLQPLDGIPERQVGIIDAQTFIPFLHWNDMKTSRAIVKGQGYGGNLRTGSWQYGVDLPFLDVTRDSTTNTCYMRNNDVTVVDMKNEYVAPYSPMAFTCGASLTDQISAWWTGYQTDGYDRINGANSPPNDALYIGSVIKQMYNQWYGLDVLTRQNSPMRLVMRVHCGQEYGNAYWDGRQMTFGDGDSQMYPLVTLGIGAHEISHGFTEQHSDLNYVEQSGGMNESFSDMAAQAVEFYAKGISSWSIGGDVMKDESGRKVLRYMDIPSRDGRSIDTADKYQEGMDVHYSSGVYNRLFYLLANQSGWDVRQAFHVMLKANMDYWTPYADFEQGACGVLHATQDLALSVDAVKLSLDGVGIGYQECGA